MVDVQKNYPQTLSNPYAEKSFRFLKIQIRWLDIYFDDCELDVSLPACVFYENRWNKFVRYVKCDIGDGKYMIYKKRMI